MPSEREIEEQVSRKLIYAKGGILGYLILDFFFKRRA